MPVLRYVPLYLRTIALFTWKLERTLNSPREIENTINTGIMPVRDEADVLSRVPQGTVLVEGFP